MSTEDGDELMEQVQAGLDDLPASFRRCRDRRTARVVLSSRERGRLYHAAGVGRLVRNDLFRNRTPQDFHRSLHRIYGCKRDDS
jgi:3-hydroxybenzoate 6-monooxygenase